MLPRRLLVLALVVLAPACGGGGKGGVIVPGAVNLGMLGTSGGAHAGTIYLTVIDSRTGTALAGAIVSLGLSGTTFLTTDVNGQGSFNGLAAASPQILTAAAIGYSTYTFYNSTAQNVTFALAPSAWTAPTISGTVSGIAAGVSGNRGTVSSDIEYNTGAPGEDPSLDTPTIVATSDTYSLTMAAGKSFAVSAIDYTGASNFVVLRDQPPLGSGETRTLDFAFPSPPAVPLSLTLGTVTTPASLPPPPPPNFPLVWMRMIFPGSATGSVQCGQSVLLFPPYSINYFTSPGVELYQLIVFWPSANGIGVGFATSAAPFTAPPDITIPEVPALAAPAAGAVGQGISPVLAWAPVAGASLYTARLTWTDTASPRAWEMTIAPSLSSLSIPTLPAAVVGQGLTVGNAVSWQVGVSVITGFDINDATQASTMRNVKGSTGSNSQTFTP